MTVRNELIKKFGEEVNVNVNDAENRLIVTVSFINSVLSEKTQEERYKRAAEAATVVKTHYARINNVSAIWVGFVRQETRMIVFHYSQGFDFFPFDKEAQPLRAPETSTVPLETTANYLPNENVSNVFAYGIQLEGEPGKDGVTLLPSLKTTGDANVKKGPAPKTVEFDFASYAGTPRFEETVPIVFIADGELLFQTTGTFHGNDAQFCYLPVPYTAFRKMIAADQLIIVVGAKKYSLTPIQMQAMRKMVDFIKG